MLVFLHLVVLSSSQSCSMYKCKTSKIQFPDDSYCIHTISSTHYISPCKSKDYKCIPSNPLDETKCTYSSPYTAGSLIPGEPCHYSSDCFQYNTCTKGVCKGQLIGSECSRNEMCDVGSFCNSQGLCQGQLAEGSFGCASDYHCVNSAACQIVSNVDLTQNKCVKYYSLSNLQPSRGYSDFVCSSGFSNGTHCVSAPVSSKVPKVCISSNDCVSKTGGYQGNCGCGYNSQGYSYCSLFAGDKLAVEALKYYKKWFSSETLKDAHTAGRYDYKFIRSYWESQDSASLVYYDSYSKNFAAYYSAEECVLEVFGSTYLKAYQELPEESSSFGFIAVVVTSVFLF